MSLFIFACEFNGGGAERREVFKEVVRHPWRQQIGAPFTTFSLEASVRP